MGIPGNPGDALSTAFPFRMLLLPLLLLGRKKGFRAILQNTRLRILPVFGVFLSQLVTCAECIIELLFVFHLFEKVSSAASSIP